MTFVVLDDEPTDTLVPATVPTTPGAAATVPSTTTADVLATVDRDRTTDASASTTIAATIPPPSGAEPSRSVPPTSNQSTIFTPLALDIVATGLEDYWVDYQLFIDAGPEQTAGLTRYRTTDGSAAIEMWLTNRIGSFDELGEATTYDVDGRTVFDANTVEGCSSTRCSVALQWDDDTLVTLQWLERPGTLPNPDAGSEPSIDRLLEAVGNLAETAPFAYRSAVSAGPTISRDGVIIADANGVTARDGWDEEPTVITTTPASKAIGLPDGRVIVQTTDNAAPGELFIADPSSDPDALMEPFWLDAVPDDGSVRLDIQDAATAFDRNGDAVEYGTLLLYQATVGSCGGSGQCVDMVETIERTDGETEWRDRTIIYDLGDVSETTVDLDIRPTGIIAGIAGVVTEGDTTAPLLLELDGESVGGYEDLLDETYTDTPVSVAVQGLFFGAQVGRDDIEIRDEGGGRNLRYPIDEVVAPDRVVSGIELLLFPTEVGSVVGSVWVESSGAGGVTFIEIVVSEGIVQRIDAAGADANLTANNRNI